MPAPRRKPSPPMSYRERLRRQRDDFRARDQEPLTADQVAELRRTGVVVKLDHRQRIKSAHRSDVFERLSMARDVVAAVRRLEGDLAARYGVGDRDDAIERVDKSASVVGVTQRQLEAAERVTAALDRIGARCAKLLTTLIEPAVIEGRVPRWREAVAKVTGERRAECQAAVVRLACVNLADAYAQIDGAQ